MVNGPRLGALEATGLFTVKLQFTEWNQYNKNLVAGHYPARRETPAASVHMPGGAPPPDRVVVLALLRRQTGSCKAVARGHGIQCRRSPWPRAFTSSFSGRPERQGIVLLSAENDLERTGVASP